MHKIELFAAGTHTSESHIRSSVQLTQHQKHAIKTAVGASPLSIGYSVHRNLSNVGMNVSNDKGTRSAVSISLLVFSWNIHFSPGLSTFLLVNQKCSIFSNFDQFFSLNFLLEPDFGL